MFHKRSFIQHIIAKSGKIYMSGLINSKVTAPSGPDSASKGDAVIIARSIRPALSASTLCRTNIGEQVTITAILKVRLALPT